MSDEQKTTIGNETSIVIIIAICIAMAIFVSAISYDSGYDSGTKAGWNYSKCMIPSAESHSCIVPDGLEGVIPSHP